jgi:hypothetical protein
MSEELIGECERLLNAWAHPLRRGHHAQSAAWIGTAWEVGTGKEVAECGHRHFVSSDEALRCPALDPVCPPDAIEAELQAAVPSLIRQLCDAMTRVTEMIDKTDRPDWELTDYGQGAARFARRLRRVMNGEDEYPPTPPVATKGEREA